ncbi:hypothetical protein [Fusobacterium animalis]|uniref:hypothetical protein n=1 Tax=Fusobacterium animalis TaxID=76859 RepID=UPI00324DBE7E
MNIENISIKDLKKWLDKWIKESTKEDLKECIKEKFLKHLGLLQIKLIRKI